MVSNELLFVYGTLRMDAVSPLDKFMARHCKLVAEAHLQGKLYDIGGYPGATTSVSHADKVYGELYEIKWASQLWPQLDHYEHCSRAFTKPYEYVRKKHSVLLANGERVQAWVYLFNWKTGGLLQVHSGDYLKYIEGVD